MTMGKNNDKLEKLFDSILHEFNEIELISQIDEISNDDPPDCNCAP